MVIDTNCVNCWKGIFCQLHSVFFSSESVVTQNAFVTVGCKCTVMLIQKPRKVHNSCV